MCCKMSCFVRFEDLGLREYKDTWVYQERIFNDLVSRKSATKNVVNDNNETNKSVLIFVEHPHVFTLGKNGYEENLLLNSVQLKDRGATFFKTDRGGDITYHGPGQIVGYPVFDLETMKISLREYIYMLEDVIMQTIAEFGIKGERLKDATGVWLDIDIPQKTRKICAIGVRASRYVTMHGFAFNVNTNLDYFSFINPCGFTDKSVTSLEKETGVKQDLNTTKNIVRNKMQKVFDIEWINN